VQICTGNLLWGVNVALGGDLLWGWKLLGVMLLWGVNVALGGDLLWGWKLLGVMLLWGVNVALGRQCCSGRGFALGRSYSGEFLWGVN